MSDLDDLTRDQLPPDARAVADALDDWLFRHHGVMSGHHLAGSFLKLLAEEGYEVRPVAERRVLEAARAWRAMRAGTPTRPKPESADLIAAVDALAGVEAGRVGEQQQ